MGTSHAGALRRRNAAAGGGPMLLPAGLAARLTARAGVTTDAFGVLSLADQFGTFHAAQTVDADKPGYTPGVSIDFDGSNHWLDWDGLVTGPAWTLMMAIDAAGAPGTQRIFNSTLAGDVRLYYRRFGNTEAMVSGVTFGSAPYVPGPQILTLQGDGAGNAHLWRNGSPLGSAPVTDVGFGGAIGLCAAFTGAEPFAGSLFEVQVYGATLDASQRESARAWLTAEHGL